MHPSARQQFVFALAAIILPTYCAGQEHEHVERMEQRIHALQEHRRQIIRQFEALRGEEAEGHGERLQQIHVDLETQIHAMERELDRARHDRDSQGQHHAPGEHHPGHAPDHHPDHEQHHGPARGQHELAAARARLEHMRRAHEHAMAAGMDQIAERIVAGMEQLQQRMDRAAREVDRRQGAAFQPPTIDPQFRREIMGAMRKLHANIDQLRADINELREEVEELEEEIEDQDQDDDEDDDEDDDDDDD